LVEQAVTRVQQTTGEAVDTLKRLLTCGHASTEARAAVSLLDFAVRGVEAGDLAQQVAELRAEMEEMKNPGSGNPAGAGQEDAGGSGEASGEDSAAAGEVAGGPGEDPLGDGPAPRPVAGETTNVHLSEDVTPLFAPGGEKFDGRCPRSP